MVTRDKTRQHVNSLSQPTLGHHARSVVYISLDLSASYDLVLGGDQAEPMNEPSLCPAWTCPGAVA